MSKQLGLKDFDGLVEVPLTLSVAKLVAAGWSLRRIAKQLKLKSHQNVAYHRDKAVKQRILKQSPLGWVIDREFIPSVSLASQGCQKPRALGSVGCRYTAKDKWKSDARRVALSAGGGSARGLLKPNFSPRQRFASPSECRAVRVRESEGWGKARLGACEAPRSKWGKHFVKGIFPIKRAPNWELVKGLAHRVVAVKPAQYVFYDGSVTLTVRSRSVRVDVFGCEGESVEAVLEEAKERARVKLGDFLYDFGGELREGRFTTSKADWTLDHATSALFLKFKPELADSSHPRQVEVDETVKERIDCLLEGGLEERLARLEGNVERLVSLLEKFNNLNNVSGVSGVKEPDWSDRS